MLERYVQSQNTLRPLTNEANLEKYYDIYDIATGDLDQLELNISQRNLEDQYSLRSLRDLFGKLYTARKIVLCCLLALSADGGASDVARWSSAVDEMRELAAVTGSSMTKMANILNEEDREYYSNLHRLPIKLISLHRRCANSTLTVAVRFSFAKQGTPAIPIPQIELLGPRRSCLACKDAYRQ